MKYLTALFAIWSCCACSQNKPDLGPVKSDPYFSLKHSLSPKEKECGLDDIYHSKNELEIRLNVEGQLFVFTELYVLTYNDTHWTAIKYGNKSLRKKQDTTALVKALFNTLRQNNIFTLPDQDSIKLPSTFSVDDGVYYTLTFKTGNSFRSYNFNNPDPYLQEFKSIKAFENYTNIVNAFNGAF